MNNEIVAIFRRAIIDNGTTATIRTGLTAGVEYDFIDAQQTSSTVETYVYKKGGSGGATVRTITLTYTDSTKSNLDTVEYA